MIFNLKVDSRGKIYENFAPWEKLKFKDFIENVASSEVIVFGGKNRSKITL